ncbi:MAG: hypothetical protein F6K30_18190 [Cyanothece sp. SIO2G6]|nr:hypothetical protein [Cyanothece sp. SIO2G6]
MLPTLSLSPRYTLDDASPWLVGIDPVRRYWIQVNGDNDEVAVIPGLVGASMEQVKEALLQFRQLPEQEQLTLPTFGAGELTIHHIAANLYAIAHSVNDAPTWHLFDRETMEAFLRTAHPDWQCSPKDMELGRDALLQSWQQPVAVKNLG